MSCENQSKDFSTNVLKLSMVGTEIQFYPYDITSIRQGSPGNKCKYVCLHAPIHMHTHARMHHMNTHTCTNAHKCTLWKKTRHFIIRTSQYRAVSLWDLGRGCGKQWWGFRNLVTVSHSNSQKSHDPERAYFQLE